jgi:NhaA family Na+:H+ antiporter
LIPPGLWTRGWGVPVGTDTAFAVAIIAAMGQRVPIELRIFLTAAAIVDDIGAILIVAVFYSHGLDWAWLGAAVAVIASPAPKISPMRNRPPLRLRPIVQGVEGFAKGAGHA